jgi:hypothetical protein
MKGIGLVLVFFLVSLSIQAQDLPENIPETTENQGVTDRDVEAFVLGENQFQELGDEDPVLKENRLPSKVVVPHGFIIAYLTKRKC